MLVLAKRFCGHIRQPFPSPAAYAVYFTDGGQVVLDVSPPAIKNFSFAGWTSHRASGWIFAISRRSPAAISINLNPE